MAWYKKLFGISESPKEVSTGIEIGPGIQLMCGDSVGSVEPMQQHTATEVGVDCKELLSLQEQINALSESINHLNKQRVEAYAMAHNEQIRLLRASEYPAYNLVIEALIEAQEGRPEALEAIKVKRASVRSKYPKSAGIPNESVP
jgi:hypothetical protein